MGDARRRPLKTVTGVSGSADVYADALDPGRSTVASAIEIAKLAETHRFDALFAADLLSFGAQGAIGAQEPLIFLAALRSVTSQIGLIATVTTTFHHPYKRNRSRRAATGSADPGEPAPRCAFGTAQARSRGNLQRLRPFRKDLARVDYRRRGHRPLGRGGYPEQLADTIAERYDAGVLDVISLGGLADPRTRDFLLNGLLPELRRRHIVGDDYVGATFRDNLELPPLPPVG